MWVNPQRLPSSPETGMVLSTEPRYDGRDDPMAGDETLDHGALGAWVHAYGERVPRQRGHRRQVSAPRRFAFYGRISTDGYQDPATSREWQMCAAMESLAGNGVIVAEYFDIGHSRLEEWADRPQAAALLAAVASPHRGFDAIVVGEYERAFCGDQLLRLMPLLEQHGVQLWLPELDGPFQADDVEHRATIRALGAYSRREILRARFRTSAAMHAQPVCRAVTSAAGHPTATGSPTPDHIRTPSTPHGGGDCISSNPTRKPLRPCDGSSPSG
jgi:hypothetical protein